MNYNNASDRISGPELNNVGVDDLTKNGSIVNAVGAFSTIRQISASDSSGALSKNYLLALFLLLIILRIQNRNTLSFRYPE